tara:strand:+ start:74 stop:751 length:678 start_codon:yes stop_codon:yes gene_type:complete
VADYLTPIYFHACSRYTDSPWLCHELHHYVYDNEYVSLGVEVEDLPTKNCCACGGGVFSIPSPSPPPSPPPPSPPPWIPVGQCEDVVGYLTPIYFYACSRYTVSPLLCHELHHYAYDDGYTSLEVEAEDLPTKNCCACGGGVSSIPSPSPPPSPPPPSPPPWMPVEECEDVVGYLTPLYFQPCSYYADSPWKCDELDHYAYNDAYSSLGIDAGDLPSANCCACAT